MKLSQVIAIWDELQVKDTGEVGFYDLEKAINKIIGIENDVENTYCNLMKDREAAKR